MAPRYKLKLSKLDFISIVDEPAQPNAKCLLIKRDGKSDRISATARLVKTSDELGLAFFWAFTSTNIDGSDHHDLQGDAISADDAMIKACADFMERGGPADQQHDSSTIGKTVFAMPMTPEIAKAFGVITKTSGLMIAIRPSKEVLAKLKNGDYTGVSIAGLGERTPVEKRRVKKDVVLTSLEAGHQHTVDLEDPLCGYSDSLSTSYQTAEGADNGHSHAWVFDAATGAVTIAADSGHTHTVSDAVPANVLTAAAAIDVAEDERIAAVPAEIAAEPCAPIEIAAEESSGVKVVVVQASAKSPRRAPVVKVDSQPEPIMPNEKTIVVLTEAQHAHMSKLSGSDLDAFLAKSHADREVIVKAALDADAPIFKGELTGTEVRKSDGALALTLAKQAEANAKTMAAQTADIAKAREERQVEIYKATAKKDLAALAGTEDAKVALLKSIDAIADEPTRTAVTTALKGANAAMQTLGKMSGTTEGAPESGDAQARLDAAVQKHATANKTSIVKAYADVLTTREGAQLYAEVEAEKTAARRS